MASVPNMRPAPLPAAPGAPPAAAGPAGFAKKLAEIPEELLQLQAAILAGGGGEEDAAAPDESAKDGAGDAEAVATTDAPSDAARLAALAPLLQSLPAMVPASVLAPAQQSAPKVETAPATTAPAVLPPAAAPTAPTTGKIARVKPEAETDTTDPEADTGKQDAAPTLDAAAKEAVAAAKRTLDAALRTAQPAIADAAPKAARAVAPALQTVKEALPATLAAEIKGAIDGLAASTAALAAQPAPAPSAAAQPRDTAAAPAPASGPTLDIENDAQWLDRLARDIAQASGNEGAIAFRLHPQTLGHLRVELSQGDHGTSIRLTTETEQARAILADAQPRLVAEARAQGVRIAEAHVDLSGSDRNASDDPRRQAEASQTPLIRTARDAATGEDAPERPGRSRSDRYA